MTKITRVPENMSGRQLARQRKINTKLTKFQLEKAEKLLSNITKLIVKIKGLLAAKKYADYGNFVLALEKDIISYSKFPYIESKLLNYVDDLKVTESKWETNIILDQIAEYIAKERGEIKKR